MNIIVKSLILINALLKKKWVQSCLGNHTYRWIIFPHRWPHFSFLIILIIIIVFKYNSSINCRTVLFPTHNKSFFYNSTLKSRACVGIFLGGFQQNCRLIGISL